MTKISEINKEISEADLKDVGLSVENIVATLNLGQELDLLRLAEFLNESEYEPETTPFLIYRPSGFTGTILVPTNGIASFVGCKSKNDLIQLSDYLISQLSEVVPEELPRSSQLEIQNIVIQGEFGTELELTEITVLLGMEKTEYEPEQFPGVIYRPSDGRTVLIFSSGKFMINGATSYDDARITVRKIIKLFRDAGVPMDSPTTE